MARKTKTKAGFVKFGSWIHQRHLEELSELSFKRQVPKKDIIYSALENYFHPPDKRKEKDILIAAMRRNLKEVEILQDSVEVVLEMFSVFIRVWLSHTKEVPEREKEKAQELAEKRFENFKKLLLGELREGRGFIGELEASGKGGV